MAVVAYAAATVLTTVRVLAAHDLESAVQDLHLAASSVLFFRHLNEELGVVHLPKELLEHECPNNDLNNMINNAE